MAQPEVDPVYPRPHLYQPPVVPEAPPAFTLFHRAAADLKIAVAAYEAAKPPVVAERAASRAESEDTASTLTLTPSTPPTRTPSPSAQAISAVSRFRRAAAELKGEETERAETIWAKEREEEEVEGKRSEKVAREDSVVTKEEKEREEEERKRGEKVTREDSVVVKEEK